MENSWIQLSEEVSYVLQNQRIVVRFKPPDSFGEEFLGRTLLELSEPMSDALLKIRESETTRFNEIVIGIARKLFNYANLVSYGALMQIPSEPIAKVIDRILYAHLLNGHAVLSTLLIQPSVSNNDKTRLKEEDARLRKLFGEEPTTDP